ncbi:MAG: SAM-dependent methyltransferase [Acidimicrobiaceae bacterium]|nr:SAM-dependent methyltransferase [Acidimicrobiaceae bacterium]
MTNDETSESRWDSRYRENPILKDPSFFLCEHYKHFPPAGTVVDVAGGNGQNAIWLANQGFSTTLLDVSSVAINQAQEFAKKKKVAIECLQHDLEKESMPKGRKWDGIFVQLFLDRELIRSISESLNIGGVFLFAHPTRTNLEKNKHPSDRFLLADGEIFTLAEELQKMRILEIDESWRNSGRYEAWLIAQKIET